MHERHHPSLVHIPDGGMVRQAPRFDTRSLASYTRRTAAPVGAALASSRRTVSDIARLLVNTAPSQKVGSFILYHNHANGHGGADVAVGVSSMHPPFLRQPKRYAALEETFALFCHELLQEAPPDVQSLVPIRVDLTQNETILSSDDQWVSHDTKAVTEWWQFGLYSPP